MLNTNWMVNFSFFSPVVICASILNPKENTLTCKNLLYKTHLAK